MEARVGITNLAKYNTTGASGVALPSWFLSTIMEDDGLLKRHDFAPRHPDAEIHNDKPWTNDADSDTTATGSSDEFNWDEGEEKQRKADVKARRGRLLYVAFMKLARPIRALLVGIIGSGLLITPFLVVHFQFNDNPIRTQVFVWSIWLAVTWSAGCVTYLFVDMLPRLIIFLVSSCGGHVERLKIQIEVRNCVLYHHDMLMSTSLPSPSQAGSNSH